MLLAVALPVGCAAPQSLSASLTGIPPIAKIGLIAPFEGLYRPRGYAALAALRRGLESCAPQGLALIPLALDGGDSPDQNRRAAAKLSLDPSVRAVIGPLDLASAAATAEIFAGRDLPWIVPALVAPAGGYAERPDAASIGPLVATLLQTQSQLPARLLVVGLPSSWQPDDLAEFSSVPLHRLDSSAALLQSAQAGDAVLWLGPAHEASSVQTQLSAEGVALRFWLGPATDASVFAAHGTGKANWLTWQNPASDSDDSDDFDSKSGLPSYITYMELEQELVYQATCAALARLETDRPARMSEWEVRAYGVDADGALTPLTLR